MRIKKGILYCAGAFLVHWLLWFLTGLIGVGLGVKGETKMYYILLGLPELIFFSICIVGFHVYRKKNVEKKKICMMMKIMSYIAGIIILGIIFVMYCCVDLSDVWM